MEEMFSSEEKKLIIDAELCKVYKVQRELIKLVELTQVALQEGYLLIQKLKEEKEKLE